MVSFSRACLFLALAAAPAAVADETTVEVEEEETSVQLCSGETLALVANGCVDSEACKLAAEEMGLQIGGENEPFVGNWADKGCYFYPEDHPLYANQAYFGEQGTCAELRMQPMSGAERVSCDGSTIPPFDAERCPGELCINAASCEEAALSMGLSIGGAQWPFEGDWPIKGCVYFPDTDPLYPNEAYWGTGASICGQLRAEPTDGSKRIICSGGEEAEVEGEVEDETAAVESEEVSSTTQTTEAPVATPVTTPVATPTTAAPLPVNATDANSNFIDDFNLTAPAPAPVFEDDEDDEDGEDDKNNNDKNDKEDDGRENSISAIESDAISAASSNGVVHVFFLVSGIIAFFSANL